MSDKIILYWTSVSSSKEVKKEQQRIEMVLSGKRIEFEKVDISLVEGAKEKMREIINDPSALPPQLCKGDVYLGVNGNPNRLKPNYRGCEGLRFKNYQQFEEAIESEVLEDFLRLK